MIMQRADTGLIVFIRKITMDLAQNKARKNHSARISPCSHSGADPPLNPSTNHKELSLKDGMSIQPLLTKSWKDMMMIMQNTEKM
jgi:hypothetical protein